MTSSPISRRSFKEQRMSTAEKPASSDVGFFFAGDRLDRTPFKSARPVTRPSSLQSIINVSYAKMLAADVALVAQHLAGKVFGKLLKAGQASLAAQPLQSPLQECFDFCTKALRRYDGYRELAENLHCSCECFFWEKSPSGPFASKNFDSSNAHAVIVGPGGAEERADARIGITILKPYTRMPDHRLSCPRTYLALSAFEFSTESVGWTRAQVGTVCFAPAGEIVAYRCTMTPLLMIWCDIPCPGTFITRK